MAETIGKITNIKVGSFLPDTVNAFDIGTLTVKEAVTNASWTFYLWNTRDDAPAVKRVVSTQRLAFAREAAIHKLTVHVTHDSDSSLVDYLQVDFV
jgi:hypothetical protein